jgi:hypothetical protein
VGLAEVEELPRLGISGVPEVEGALVDRGEGKARVHNLLKVRFIVVADSNSAGQA